LESHESISNLQQRVFRARQHAGNRRGSVHTRGKAKYEANKPGYGPRAVPPALGNDPMGTCDPLGIPRLLNTEVITPHQTMEIVQIPAA
jgi:hypothetical protein